VSRTPRRIKKVLLRSLLHYARTKAPTFQLSRVEARLCRRWFRRQGIRRISAVKVSETAIEVRYAQ